MKSAAVNWSRQFGPCVSSGTVYHKAGFGACGAFRQPPGTMLTWVCRNNPDYLDLAEDPLTVSPK